ncbi:MAG: WXG100 family type VII secretion target [Lachnospiraceae bacterium]|nr:WXG100 family type VII secretion target [Lachnospiraceae bacterium]
MEGRIVVSTQELLNASGEFQARNSAINDITGQMLNLARGLNSCWEGESATGYVNKFNELEDDMQMINKMITEHVNDLQEMAAAYDKAEQTVATYTQQNTNLIS